MEQTADNLANASPVAPKLFSAVSSQVGDVVVPKAATIPPLQREVFGFAFGNASLGDTTYGYPAWSMNLLTTIAYFGLTTNWDGTFVQSGSGWTTWTAAPGLDRDRSREPRVDPVDQPHDFSASWKSTMCAALHPTLEQSPSCTFVRAGDEDAHRWRQPDYEGTNSARVPDRHDRLRQGLRFEMASLAMRCAPRSHRTSQSTLTQAPRATPLASSTSHRWLPT
jgi:hypothetical protein